MVVLRNGALCQVRRACGDQGASMIFPEPIHQVRLAYEKERHWIEQYTCSLDCISAIRSTRVCVSLEGAPGLERPRGTMRRIGRAD